MMTMMVRTEMKSSVCLYSLFLLCFDSVNNQCAKMFVLVIIDCHGSICFARLGDKQFVMKGVHLQHICQSKM